MRKPYDAHSRVSLSMPILSAARKLVMLEVNLFMLLVVATIFRIFQIDWLFYTYKCDLKILGIFSGFSGDVFYYNNIGFTDCIYNFFNIFALICYPKGERIKIMLFLKSLTIIL